MAATHCDVIVAGLGAMGSQTLAELARRGVRTIGFDRFTPPHAMGSSHGRSRIIREAYFEDPAYVPLVQHAYERWRALERESGATLLRTTGGLCYGPPAGALVTGALRSARQHALPHEELDARDLRRRFPAFVVRDDWTGVLESRAGILDPARAISAALEVARRAGATTRTDEPVLAWRQQGDGVQVETARGRYSADRLVLAAGMWMPALLADLKLPVRVQRNVVYWFRAARAADRLAADRLPVFLGDLGPGLMWYGIPDLGDGLKIGLHHFGEVTTPELLDRRTYPGEEFHIRRLLMRYLPDACGRLESSEVCTYTNLPDEHFLLDRHPHADRVWLASPCSGHGFKFSSALGEVLADLVTGARCGFDLTPFRLDRPALRGG